MSRRGGVKIALVLVIVAACQGKSAEPGGAGSGSAAAAPVAPALQLMTCGVAEPRPSRMRSGAPSVPDLGIPVPAAGGGGIGTGSIGLRPADLAPGPRARIGIRSLQVTGPLDRLLVRRFMRRQLLALDACYTVALANAATLEGALTVTFDLDRIGAVKNARATGVPGSLPACVVKVVEEMKFPSGEGKTNQIQAVLKFAPQLVPAAAALPPTAWTPYAVVRVPAPADPSTVDAAQVEIRAHLVELDACFGAATGSVRAMIEITADGHVQRARVGGLGVQAAEVCAARALQRLAIAAPAAPVELACDLSRGAPQPWRVTREAYAVFEVDAARIVSPDGTSRAFADPPANPSGAGGDASGAYLVLAAPDAPGSAIESAIAQASLGGVSIIAVRATGGAPVFVGVGPDLATSIDSPGNLGIAVTEGIARVCTDGADVAQTAPVIDPSALDRLVAAGLAACKPPCTAASVSVVGDYIGKDLVAVTAAARRAKLATIVAGAGCSP